MMPKCDPKTGKCLVCKDPKKFQFGNFRECPEFERAAIRLYTTCEHLIPATTVCGIWSDAKEASTEN